MSEHAVGDFSPVSGLSIAWSMDQIQAVILHLLQERGIDLSQSGELVYHWS